MYYLFPILFHSKDIGITRTQFIEAMVAEGMPLANYVRPLNTLPLYAKEFGQDDSYNLDSLPIVKDLWENSMMVTPICRPPLEKNHIDEFIASIDKIVSNIGSLK